PASPVGTRPGHSPERRLCAAIRLPFCCRAGLQDHWNSACRARIGHRQGLEPPLYATTLRPVPEGSGKRRHRPPITLLRPYSFWSAVRVSFGEVDKLVRKRRDGLTGHPAHVSSAVDLACRPAVLPARTSLELSYPTRIILLKERALDAGLQ